MGSTTNIPVQTKIDIANRWFALNREERQAAGLPTTMKDMCRFLGIGMTKFKKMKDAYRLVSFNTALSKVDPGKVIEGDFTEGYDSVKYLRSRTPETDKALVQSCLRGNAQALRLLKQLLGDLVEKQETMVKIDGSFITKAILRAERELRDNGYGVAEMQEEFPLLPPELRSDSGQG